MLKRERFAWAWLASLLVVPTIYFIVVATREPMSGRMDLVQLGMLATALTALALVALLARFLPFGGTDGPNPFGADERDQLIESRASVVAYYVLMGGMIVVGFVMPFIASGWVLVHAALLATVLAETVHTTLMLISYRRGVRA
jgi:hypothetical protein